MGNLRRTAGDRSGRWESMRIGFGQTAGEKFTGPGYFSIRFHIMSLHAKTHLVLFHPLPGFLLGTAATESAGPARGDEEAHVPDREVVW